MTSNNGKDSDLAVVKCKQLLSDIREYGLYHKKVFCKRTRNGEQRIKSCVKYEMGRGYRLVTVMFGNHLFVTFLGSHDETDLWFDRHKRNEFLPENPNYKTERIDFSESINRPISAIGSKFAEPDAYEAQLEAKLDESTLLEIFKGLHQNQESVVKENI